MQLSDKPHYLVINDENQSIVSRQILRTKASLFSFPLSAEDRASITKLERAFDEEGKIAGLAAPQIGIEKQVIVFQAPIELKKWREDFSEAMPKTIWLNPRYEASGMQQRVDYEGCFSVGGVAGKVPRFSTIKYEAYLLDGSKVEGVATGYLARVLQHEIDHLHGILFIDKIPSTELVALEEYYRLRNAKMGD